MSFTLCSSGAAIAKAGVNANTTFVASTATINEWSDQAEGTFSMKTRIDWVAAIASTGAMIKQSVADAVSADIGNKIINNDISGFLKGEAQTMLDVNKDTYDMIVADLREDQNQQLNK